MPKVFPISRALTQRELYVAHIRTTMVHENSNNNKSSSEKKILVKAHKKRNAVALVKQME